MTFHTVDTATQRRTNTATVLLLLQSPMGNQGLRSVVADHVVLLVIVAAAAADINDIVLNQCIIARVQY
jgi:hypothetical protein